MITPNTTIFLIRDIGYYLIPQNVFVIGKKKGHGDTDLNKAITESSDTYFYQVAYNMGIDRLSNWMKDFGFGMPTGIEIQEETAANIPTREWKQKTL